MDEINLLDIFKIIKRHWLACCIAVVLSGVAAFFITSFLVQKEYTSTVSLYVNNNASSTNLNLNDITASQKLADTYIVILENGGTFNELAKKLNGDYTADHLRNMISFSVVGGTEVVKITAVANDPDEAVKICEAFAQIAPGELEKVVVGGVVRIIGTPSRSSSPTSPNVKMSTIFSAFAAGFFVAAFYIVKSMLDTRIHSEKEISERYDVAVIGVVPEQGAAYQQTEDVKNGIMTTGKKREGRMGHNPIITDLTPFSVIEAYNKICTNIRFGVSQDKRKIIVVTSSMPGEYKSTTSTNLAISIARSGSHVLLVDADLRKPTLHNNVRVPNECGLSNILAGFCDVGDALYENLKPNLDFLPAGLLPPNPVALLGSEHAKKLFGHLGVEYDYVIVDSPPLNLVSDAALLSQYSTGVLLIIREGKSNTGDVDDAMDSLKRADANIIGMVLTGGDLAQSPYSTYGYGYSYSSQVNSRNT